MLPVPRECDGTGPGSLQGLNLVRLLDSGLRRNDEILDLMRVSLATGCFDLDVIPCGKPRQLMLMTLLLQQRLRYKALAQTARW